MRHAPFCSFNIFFNAAAKRNTDRSRAAVMKARELMIQWGVAPDRVTINAQVNHAIKEGRLDEAIDMFEKALDGVSAGFFFKNAIGARADGP